MKGRCAVGLMAVTYISGCVSTYQRDDLAAADSKLDRSQAVAIAVPKDANYGDEIYTGSGQDAALAVRAAFARFAQSTTTLDNCRDLACMRASNVTTGYIVVPEILHWEDRATQWSGRPDKVEIKITVTDARSQNNLSATIISGKSKWATFGGDHPQDLLAEPITTYVKSLY